jgi:hypothetical protein
MRVSSGGSVHTVRSRRWTDLARGAIAPTAAPVLSYASAQTHIECSVSSDGPHIIKTREVF